MGCLTSALLFHAPFPYGEIAFFCDFSIPTNLGFRSSIWVHFQDLPTSEVAILQISRRGSGPNGPKAQHGDPVRGPSFAIFLSKPKFANFLHPTISVLHYKSDVKNPFFGDSKSGKKFPDFFWTKKSFFQIFSKGVAGRACEIGQAGLEVLPGPDPEDSEGRNLRASHLATSKICQLGSPFLWHPPKILVPEVSIFVGNVGELKCVL